MKKESLFNSVCISSFRNTGIGLMLMLSIGISVASAQKKKIANSSKNAPSIHANTPVYDLNALLKNDSNVRVGRLSNGLSYYILKNDKPQKQAEIALVVKGGSVVENDQQRGMAEFVSQIALLGTKNFSKDSITSFLSKASSSTKADANISATFDNTIYQISIPNDKISLQKGLLLLSDWATSNINFDSDAIKNVKSAMISDLTEAATSKDQLLNQSLPTLLSPTQYASRLPMGNKSSIEQFDQNGLKQFYNTWYRPDLEAIIAVGDFDPNSIEELIKSSFQNAIVPTITPSIPNVDFANSNDLGFQKLYSPNLQFAVAMLFYKHPSPQSIKTYQDLLSDLKIQLFNQLISARMNERLSSYDQITAAYSKIINSVDAYNISIACDAKNTEKAIKSVALENASIKKYGFTESELIRAKKVVFNNLTDAKADTAQLLSTSMLDNISKQFLYQKSIFSNDAKWKFFGDYLSKITLKEMNTLSAELISDNNQTLIVLCPNADKAVLASDDILKQQTKVADSEIPVYTDNAVERPLIAQALPTTNKIVAENKIIELNITEITLSNGIKVVLKPSQNSKSNVVLSASCQGGASVVSDAQYWSSTILPEVINASGLDNLKRSQLEKLLAGSSAKLSIGMRELFNELNGSAKTKDLETLLQLSYLYLTKPQVDSTAFNTVVEKTKANIAVRDTNALVFFKDSCASILGNVNMRRITPSVRMFNHVSMQDIANIYQNGFCDVASKFTFWIVGDFDVEAIKPLLNKYLGNIPSSNREVKYRDLNIQTPSGRLTKVIRKGDGHNGSVVRIVFSGDYLYSNDNNNYLYAFEDIVGRALNARLQQEPDRKAYNPRLNVSLRKIPTGRYSISLSFICSPDDIDYLIDVCLDVLNGIKRNGISADAIAGYVARSKKNYSDWKKDDNFWLTYLKEQYELNEDIKVVLYTDADLSTISSETIKTVADKYLSRSNMIELVLLPENY